MAEDWTPISRVGHPDVKSLTANGRAEVHVQLSAVPPREWAEHFVGLYTGFLVRSPDDDWPLPEVRGVNVVIWPLRGELESWISTMAGRIDQANDYYQHTVLPEKERRTTAKDETNRQAEEELERYVVRPATTSPRVSPGPHRSQAIDAEARRGRRAPRRRRAASSPARCGSGLPAPHGTGQPGRLWDRREVETWAKKWR